MPRLNPVDGCGLDQAQAPQGMAHVMITHSLADPNALSTEEDRAKARGFIDRSAITVLAGLPPRELDRVAEITPLTAPERAPVASWSAPESYLPGARHPAAASTSSNRRAARHPRPAHPRRPRATPI